MRALSWLAVSLLRLAISTGESSNRSKRCKNAARKTRNVLPDALGGRPPLIREDSKSRLVSSFLVCCAYWLPGAARLAGGSRDSESRRSQGSLNRRRERVRTTEYTPRCRFYLLERRDGLADIVERCVGVVVGRAGRSSCNISLGTARIAARRGPVGRRRRRNY